MSPEWKHHPYPAPRRRGDPAGVRRGQPPDCGDTPGGAQRDRQPDGVWLRRGGQSNRDHGQLWCSPVQKGKRRRSG